MSASGCVQHKVTHDDCVGCLQWALKVERELTAKLRTEREQQSKTLYAARNMLAVLRNAVHDHNATNACDGSETCWCDDCKMERAQVRLDPMALPAPKRARAAHLAAAKRLAEATLEIEAAATMGGGEYLGEAFGSNMVRLAKEVLGVDG